MDEDWDFVIEVDPGDDVICDYCNAEYTESDETGGLIISGYAVCPRCEPETMERIKQYKEEAYIDSICPYGMSFADYVRKSR